MTHTPGPKLCGRCGEPQPETQDWFGEAVRLKAINTDLLAALKAAQDALGNAYTVSQWMRAESGNKRDRRIHEADSVLKQGRVAIARAEAEVERRGPPGSYDAFVRGLHSNK